jgi:hypothetical protein
MKKIIKYSNKTFFAFIVLTFLAVLLFFKDSGVSTMVFTYLRDFGNILAVLILILYAYGFSTSNDKIYQSEILKRIIKLFLMLILLNFTKTLAGIFFDWMTLIQNVFFDAGYGEKFVKLFH